jgi:hypothetical protein
MCATVRLLRCRSRHPIPTLIVRAGRPWPVLSFRSSETAMAARKPYVIHNAQREARQLLVNATPLIQAYGVEEVGVELTFADPEGKQQPSPRGTTYTAGMHAYFYFTCPVRGCTDGGFEAHADLLGALSQHQDGHTGTLSCPGLRSRNGLKATRCNIELRYTLALRGKTKAAA